MNTTQVQRGDTFAGYNELETICCPECGVLYAIPARLLATAREKGNWKVMWYCPNGHHLGFGESELDKARRRQREAEDRAARLAAQRDQAEASARANRGAATRARNQRDRERKRVAHGVCPCCNRTFKNLHRHMTNQHPDFGPVGERDHE